MINKAYLVIERLNIKLSSHNKSILKKIDSYERRRTELLMVEYKNNLFAKMCEEDTLAKTGDRFKDQAQLARSEIDRIDRLIDELMKKIKPEQIE